LYLSYIFGPFVGYLFYRLKTLINGTIHMISAEDALISYGFIGSLLAVVLNNTISKVRALANTRQR